MKRFRREMQASVLKKSSVSEGGVQAVTAVPDAEMLAGTWETSFPADGRSLRIEYSFLKSGSGFEKISTNPGERIIELHRYFWSLDEGILKLIYITQNMTEVRMRCRFRDSRCILTDLETDSDELILRHKCR